MRLSDIKNEGFEQIRGKVGGLIINVLNRFCNCSSRSVQEGCRAATWLSGKAENY